VPGHQIDVDPHTLLELARTHDIEGVVGKRVDSPYRPGRSPAWIKHALRNRIEVVVGGWLPGKGNRTNQLGALLIGQPSQPSTAGEERGIGSSARSGPDGRSPPPANSCNSSPSCTPTPARSTPHCRASTPTTHAGCNPN
jgi:hypothetical protein